MNPTRLLTLMTAALVTATGVLPGTGCASKPAANSLVPATPESLAHLRDTDLRLSQLVVGGTAVDTSAFPITLRFGEPGKFAGRSAVNRYFGGFQLGDQGALTWPGNGLGMTRMAGPAAAMQIERQFTEALTGCSQLLTSPDGARFQNADGSHAVEFQR